MAEGSLLEKHLTPDQHSRLASYLEVVGKLASAGHLGDDTKEGSPVLPLPEDLQWVPYPMEVSPGFLIELGSLITRTGIPEGELLSKALALLVLAYQARDEGKLLAVVDEDLNIEMTISGF